MIVYEYFLDNEKNIITFQQWSQKEKPELENFPEPNEDLKINGCLDEWGNSKYKLINNVIVKNEIILTDEQKRWVKLAKRNIFEILDILIESTESTLPRLVDLKAYLNEEPK